MLARYRRKTVKLQMLIVPVVAAAALTSGCASWHAQDRGNDYQCGYAGSIEGALAGRQLQPGCGADYAGVNGASEIINERTRHELGHDRRQLEAVQRICERK